MVLTHEQGDFQLVNDGNWPGYFDRPPTPPLETVPRPNQMILPAPDLGEAFVIPKWNPDDDPAGWRFESGFIDDARLTRLTSNFVFTRTKDELVLRVEVRWSRKLFALASQTRVETHDVTEGVRVDGVDTRPVEVAALRRVERFLELHTLVSTHMDEVTLSTIANACQLGPASNDRNVPGRRPEEDGEADS